AIAETYALAKLSSPHVTRYYDSFLEPQSTLNIVMEYCSNGTIADLIKARNGRALGEDVIWALFIQLLQGMAHIHSNRVIHRDIKPLNLFLDKDNRIKIGDLGVAKLLEEESFAQTLVGSPYYLAPELCRNAKYNARSDMWSLGVTLYEMMTFTHPFKAHNQVALIMKILRDKVPRIEQAGVTVRYSRGLVSVCYSLLSKDPLQRPTAQALLQDPTVMSAGARLGLIEGLAPKATRGPTPSGRIRTPSRASRVQGEKDRERARSRGVSRGRQGGERSGSAGSTYRTRRESGTTGSSGVRASPSRGPKKTPTPPAARQVRPKSGPRRTPSSARRRLGKLHQPSNHQLEMGRGRERERRQREAARPRVSSGPGTQRERGVGVQRVVKTPPSISAGRTPGTRGGEMVVRSVSMARKVEVQQPGSGNKTPQSQLKTLMMSTSCSPISETPLTYSERMGTSY
ncbi:hypothetical protein KIPB_010666, partial [Kipferlia bialata]